MSILSRLPGKFHLTRFVFTLCIFTILQPVTALQSISAFSLLPKKEPAPTVRRDTLNDSLSKESQTWRSGISLSQYVQTFPESEWWAQFGDTTLNQLIQTAILQNPTLEIASQRVEVAKANALLSRAPLFPKISFGGQYLWQKYSQRQFLFPLRSRTFHSFAFPLSMTYEADIWGKNLKKYQVTKLQARAEQAAYHNVIIQLTTSVVSQYINLLKFNMMVESEKTLLSLNEKNQRHQKALFAEGLTSTDVLDKATQEYEASRIRYENFLSNQEQALNHLHSLLGESASQAHPLDTELLNKRLSDLKIPSTLNAGVPSEIIVHRPDIQQIEAQMQAAFINIQVARREMLPSFKLDAQTGLSALGITNVFSSRSISSYLMPTFSQPIYEGGAISAGIRYRKAEYESLFHQYRERLLSALEETENALSVLSANTDILESVTTQLAGNTRLALQQKRRFEEGLVSEPDWLPQESQRLEFEKALAQQKAEVLIDHLSVIKAVGGGF
ncbi:MAG: TolC family protein [Cyanobacteria bacterium]|nr:TolC family protein [Cyanobacteriota bacterium]